MRLPPTMLLLALALGACPPDLDRFRIVDDGGEGEGEGEGEPGACALPQVLVAVEDVSNTGAPGRVLRFHLGENDVVDRCGDLDGGGEMVSQPFVVAWIGVDRVGVASTDAVQLLDPQTGTLLWTMPSDGSWPVDAFPLLTPDGHRMAIAYGRVGNPPEVDGVRVYGDAGGVTWDWVGNGGELPIGLSVTSMTQSPASPDRMLALKPSDYAAAEIDPWRQNAMTSPPYAWTVDGVVLDTISAIKHGLENRLVWAGHEVEGGASHLYYERDQGGQGDFRVSGPIDCAGRACTFIHAVPDPSLNTRMIGICEEGGDYSSRRIVRFRSTAEECDVLFEGSSLPPMSRMSRLSVAMERAQ